MEIGDLLKKIRGRDSLREAAKKTGLSHGYINIIEKGVDPRTKSPLRPSPETLKAYSIAYHFSYEDLMVAAGYIDENKKESEGVLSESQIDKIIKQTEEHYNVNLHDDPVVLNAMKQLAESLAKMKQGKQ